jgi:hypothetical protein
VVAQSYCRSHNFAKPSFGKVGRDEIADAITDDSGQRLGRRLWCRLHRR